MPPYLYTRSRVRKEMIPFVYDREITKDEIYYKMLGNRFCSPAKIIKRYLKRIFECVYSELEKNRIKKIHDLRDVDIFIDTTDFNCIFNPVVYSEVLDLYLIYLTLYKKYGFTKDYIDGVILKDTNFKKNSKPKFNYFDSSGVKWKKRIRLSSSDQNILLLREIPFFIEDFFRGFLEKRVSQEVVYMFSFFYLYFLVDYEFMLSNNELISGQEGLFKETKILRSFFRYILLRSKKKYLEKYLRNEEVIKVLKDNLIIPSIDGRYMDFEDKLVLKKIFKNYKIDIIDFDKLEEMELYDFVNYVVEEKFGEIGNMEEELVDNIIEDFEEFKEKEQIIYLTFAEKKLNSRSLPIFRNFWGWNDNFNILDIEIDDTFFCFEMQKILRMIDPDNRLKRRRFQDIKLSRLYLTFCGEENMKKLRFKK